MGKKLFLFFPMLLILELIFGVSGTMIMVKGVAIRHILFIMTFFSIYGYLFYYLLSNGIKIFSLKEGSFLKTFNIVDIFAVVFESAMVISMTVIPYIKGTNLHYAYSEVFDSIAIFSLYFAISYLIKVQEIQIDKLLVYIKVLIFLFGVQHIVFYFAQESNPSFMEIYFKGFVDLVGGNGIVQDFVLGHKGYTRITFNTSIYFLVGFFIFLYEFEKNKWYDYIIYSTEIIAMMTTMTKSIWLGAGVAFIIIGGAVFVYGLKKDQKLINRMIFTAILSFAIIIAADRLIFDGAVSIRLANTFVTQSDEEYEDDRMSLEREGAAVSNTIKLEQISKLLDKWKESPIVGYGYGSYVENYFRSEAAPFSYEMQFFALLMKIGILGLLLWVLFFIIQFICLLKSKKHEWLHIYAWIFLLISIVICVQTNPLLISFTGMSVLLFISIITINEISHEEVQA